MNLRRLVVFLHDLVAAALAWLAAYWLRFNLEVPPDFAEVMLARLPLVLGVHAGVFWLLGLYRGLWRYASLPDLRGILLGVGVAALAVPTVLTLFDRGEGVPRSVYLITPLLLAMAMGGSRLAYRAWREGQLAGVVAKPQAAPVLVLGAGAVAAALVKDLAASPQWRVVGVLDDDPGKRGAQLVGVKVLGPLERVAEIAQRHSVTQAIIAMPETTHTARKRAVELCTRGGLAVMTVPALGDIVAGKVSVSALRPIELDDLLGRDPVALDDAGLHGFLDGRTVLVTGAGGSIGSELCRQIARFAPAKIVLFELSEFALYSIEQEFRDRLPHASTVAVIGDAKDEARVAEVFARYRPDVVFHAAAYKHVPLMEDDNACQAVLNNVASTLVVARAAQAHGAQVAGVEILGSFAEVGPLAERHNVTQAIIAMPEATHGERKRAVELCTRGGIAVMTVPALGDIVAGRVSVSALRPIELDDLLGRDPVALDDAGLHGFLDGRTVLVTGAGGSIGSELCRQIARFSPQRIVLFDAAEFALYSIDAEFKERFHDVPADALIGDAKD
ncbi:MAG TPA: polysaccharide biosynthesis protein, partial [Burkholderiales bacterium]|nr:polysaccharide biosynthesis protein [Burkholderiales bacterium]